MKKAKLIIDGKEIEVEITQEQLDKFCPSKKKTGYERANRGEKFYLTDNVGGIISYYDDYTSLDDALYNSAEYYSDETVAKNNARADKLMRQLRRFAVEHREKEIDWKNENQAKIVIAYNYHDNKLTHWNFSFVPVMSLAYFDSKEAVELAIDTFKDELLWYFTEYKDSL